MVSSRGYIPTRVRCDLCGSHNRGKGSVGSKNRIVGHIDEVNAHPDSEILNRVHSHRVSAICGHSRKCASLVTIALTIYILPHVVDCALGLALEKLQESTLVAVRQTN